MAPNGLILGDILAREMHGLDKTVRDQTTAVWLLAGSICPVSRRWFWQTTHCRVVELVNSVLQTACAAFNIGVNTTPSGLSD